MQSDDVTGMLNQVRQGDLDAREELFAVLLDELRAAANAMMFQERRDHTLQPSALMNEAFVRLLASDALNNSDDRRYLFAAANRAMKQVLIDHARTRSASKRPSHLPRASLDAIIDTLESRDGMSVTDLIEAIGVLQTKSPRQAELLELSFFSGLTISEMSNVLDISAATVKRDLKLARVKVAAMIRAD